MISAHETLCVIPQSLCLFDDNNSVDDAIQSITNNLIIEKNKGINSFHFPFIDVLTTDMSFIPSLWSEDKLKLLKGTYFENDATSMKSDWLKMASKNCLLLKQRDNIDCNENEWLWARANLQCRAYNFPKIKSKVESLNSITFMPFIGFANHDDKRFCSLRLGFSNNNNNNYYLY